MNLLPYRMAISSIAADHVLVGRFHFCSTSLSDSQTSFLAASSVLKQPFVLIAFLIVLFRLSMAFVV